MRILHVIAQKPDSTGSGVYLHQLVSSLCSRGIEQAVDGMYQEYGVTTDEASGLAVTSFVHGGMAANMRYMNVAALFGSALTRTGSNKAPGYIQLVTA